MRKSLDEISGYWIGQFLICIKTTLTEPQFRSFTLFVEDVESFDNVREKSGYFQDLPLYLEYLRKNGSLTKLIKKFVLKNDILDANHPVLYKFKVSLEEQYDFDKKLIIETNLVDDTNPYNFSSHLLLNNAVPFINRNDFRNGLEDRLNLLGNSPRVIFVKGESGSGMSYLGNYLTDFCAHSDQYKYIEIDVPYYLDNENNLNGSQLAKIIALKLGFKDDVEDKRGDKFKFIQFANNFSRELIDKPQTPVVFLHDFHKIPVLESINALFYELFSLSPEDINNVIVVVTGFEYENIRNWQNSLSAKVLCCDLGLFLEEDIDQFLDLIYKDYKPKLKTVDGRQISNEDYKTSMKKKLMPNNEIDVAVIGNYMKKHLKKLNSN